MAKQVSSKSAAIGIKVMMYCITFMAGGITAETLLVDFNKYPLALVLIAISIFLFVVVKFNVNEYIPKTN